MFRFTIRDVLWLTVAAALAVGWAIQFRTVDQLQHENRNLQMTAEVMREALK